MREFDEDHMEDGKPFAKNLSNDTAKTATPSLKQRYLSYIQKNEVKFCDRYDSDGESRPFVQERIMVKTVPPYHYYHHHHHPTFKKQLLWLM